MNILQMIAFILVSAVLWGLFLWRVVLRKERIRQEWWRGHLSNEGDSKPILAGSDGLNNAKHGIEPSRDDPPFIFQTPYVHNEP